MEHFLTLPPAHAITVHWKNVVSGTCYTRETRSSWAKQSIKQALTSAIEHKLYKRTTPLTCTELCNQHANHIASLVVFETVAEHLLDKSHHLEYVLHVLFSFFTFTGIIISVRIIQGSIAISTNITTNRT